MKKMKTPASVLGGEGSLRELLAAGEGFSLAQCDPDGTPGFVAAGKGSAKQQGQLALADGAAELSELQEKLWAGSRFDDTRSVLLVLQGMDTAGKGGIVRHVVGNADPGGVHYASFKAPTKEELAHDFLWRIKKQLPAAGKIGVFDRSHYEDVLIVRVHQLVSKATWSRRYGSINKFESSLQTSGCRIVKVMLHISKDEQQQRLAQRLEREDKRWKYNPGDIDERMRWEDYQQAYQAVFEQCSPASAPWYVVPANRKWYARWAVQHLLLETLREMDVQWPQPDLDVAAELQRLKKA